MGPKMQDIHFASHALFNAHRASVPQAKLFHEEAELKMATTKAIKAGEQIVSFLCPNLT